MANEAFSDFNSVASLSETDEIVGIKDANNGRWTVIVLRVILNLIAQSFAALVTFDLGIKTDTVDEKTGAGGVTIDGVLLKDGGITTTDDIKQRGKELLQSKTILGQQINPYFNFDGVSGDKITVPDDTSFSELFANGGTYICQFNAFSVGESSKGTFFNKVAALIFTDGEWFFIVVFSGDNGAWKSVGVDVPLNKDSIVVLSYNGSDVANIPTLYVDGVEVTMMEETAPTGIITTDVGSDLLISDNNGARAFHGNKYKEIFLNKELTAAEAKSFSSNPQKDIDWADIGGSNVAQNVSNCVNGNYTTFANGTPTGFDVTSDGGAVHRAGTVDELSFIKGKQYLVTFNLVLNSGTLPSILIRNSLVSGSVGFIVSGTISAGLVVLIIEATSTTTGVIAFINSSTITDYEITNLDIYQLGATLVLDPRNSSQIQTKDSANGNHSLLSDPEIFITPLVSQKYTDIYKAVSDNDTFDIPANATELQLVFDVLTGEGGTTIRIGTSNGGEQVVADVATTSQGIITATIVIENFKSGDQLFIGSDGGGGWTTLDLTVHVFYKVLDIN